MLVSSHRPTLLFQAMSPSLALSVDEAADRALDSIRVYTGDPAARVPTDLVDTVEENVAR